MAAFAHGGDDASDFTDVVGEDDRTEDLNKGHNDRLSIVNRRYVSEADCHHDRARPIITPNVYLIPCLLLVNKTVIHQFHLYPISLRIDPCCREHRSRDNMRKDYIEDYNSYQIPYVKLLYGVYEHNFQHFQVRSNQSQFEQS